MRYPPHDGASSAGKLCSECGKEEDSRTTISVHISSCLFRCASVTAHLSPAMSDYLPATKQYTFRETDPGNTQSREELFSLTAAGIRHTDNLS